MKAQVFIWVGGVMNGLFLILHLLFWEMFNWPGDLKSLSRDNSSIIQVLNIHLILVLAMFTYLSLFRSRDMLASSMGRAISLCIGLFWMVRLVNEALFWDMGDAMSQGFGLVFLALGLLYLVPLYRTRSMDSQA